MEETELLIEYYPHRSTKEVAFITGKSISQCYAKAFALQLHKTPEYLATEASGRLQRSREQSQFIKGHTPWNKGMKGLQIGGEETRFKKGHVPVNYKPIGWTRIDVEGYHWTKVEEGLNGWVLTHRLAWEMEHGPIPKGAIIRFKDGNKLNFDIENLFIIDTKQNMELKNE
jgi:hypothetical protein